MSRQRDEHNESIRSIRELMESPVCDEDLMNTMNQEICKNLNRIIEEKKISKKRLSFLTGVHISHLCNVLSGSSNIGLSALIKLAMVLNCDIQELIPLKKSTFTHTPGERFDMITKDLSVPEINFILKMIYEYVKAQHTMKEFMGHSMPKEEHN